MKKNNNDIDCTDLPTCPFCGCEDVDWNDGWDPGEGDTSTFECGRCGMEFEVEFHLYYDFTSFLLKKCPDCDGKDHRYDVDRCGTCFGNGKVPMTEEETLEARNRDRSEKDKEGEN